MTDPADGAFALESNSLQSSVDSLIERIQTLDEILVLRQERLLFEFAQMEDILATLTTQQQAIAAIAPLTVQPVGTGIF